MGIFYVPCNSFLTHCLDVYLKRLRNHSNREVKKMTFFNVSGYSWYVIPLLAIVIYIYIVEINKAREDDDWNVIFAGLTVFGMDFINETWNGWIYVLTGHAFWTTVGPTAIQLMVGWNVEIAFFFSILGIIYGNAVSKDVDDHVLGLPNRWFWAIAFAVVCVFVECLLNLGGYLVWFYPFWNLSITGIWLIFLIGYFHFFVAA
ncbi:MAG: hypothetical protein ACXQS8_07630, partial [Candidatus Helarchaeales archaeon]